MPPRPHLAFPALCLFSPSPPQLLLSLPSKCQRRSIRSILKPPPKPSRFDQSARDGAPEALSRSKVLARKTYTLPHRTGVLAIKRGQISYIDPVTAERMPATVLQIDRCQIISHKRADRHGYWAVQVGAGYRRPDNLTRAQLGHLAKHEISPKDRIAEFRVKGEAGLPPMGAELKADWFSVGQFVDCRSKTKGKGFAGVMKRHGFSGQPASHGVSLTHRSMGSSGGSQGSGSRVHPGKKMAGRMGGIEHTVQNLRVLRTDAEHGILLIKGLVSGPNGAYVRVQDSKKMPWQLNTLGLRTTADLVVEPARVKGRNGAGVGASAETETLPSLADLAAQLPEVSVDGEARV